jgi:hypothetical protein
MENTMTLFATAVKNSSRKKTLLGKKPVSKVTKTTNGMKAFTSTANACVDLFYNIAASRGKNVIPAFTAAYQENPELAVRIALWARDIRGGAGERQLFKDILIWLDKNDAEMAIKILHKVPELGRWDDLFATNYVRSSAFELIRTALIRDKNGLAAKWMPRKGIDMMALRSYMGLEKSPKRYRRLIVGLTKVVETQMCAHDWDEVNYSHVPSIASARYQKAFRKHDEARYSEWRDGLKTGETKVHATTLYPYDVLKSIAYGDRDVALAQWEALPNYVGDASILPIVDVSGSMGCRAGGGTSKSVVTCLDVAVSLGLYLADKNKGVFKDTFLTFSSKPQLVNLKGNLLQKMEQMNRSSWEMSTNIEAAFTKILEVAVKNKVPKKNMPQTVLIMSDMQFDSCIRTNDSAMSMIASKFKTAKYDLPKVVFWNLNASYGNAPAKSTQENVALVSGFSPAIMKSVLSSEDFSPKGVMLHAVMNERYSF